jgi:IS30 family transposase
MQKNTPHKLTLEDRIKIAEFIKLGYSIYGMSPFIKSTKSTISRDIRANGGREKYDPYKAQELTTRLLKEGYKKANQTRMNKPKLIVDKRILAKKIESLEFQVEILTETIRDINNKIKGNL